MIYNFVQLLRDQFPTETIYINGRILVAGQESIPDRNVLAVETGGTEKPWNLIDDITLQIVTRDVDGPKARALAYDVFNYVTSRFGLILPAITVDGDTFAALQTAQISAIQMPYLLGADGEGRIEYTTNYKIILQR